MPRVLDKTRGEVKVRLLEAAGEKHSGRIWFGYVVSCHT